MVIFFNWEMEQSVIPKNISSDSVIIKALGRRKFLKFIMEMLCEMRTEGVSLDWETPSIVLDSFVSAHHVSKAVGIFGNLDEFGFDCDSL
jgi:pentatricopeptide repeat protein